jgi:hypothetical protein
MSSFRRNADEIGTLLGLGLPDLQDGTNMLSQNVGKGLPLDAV